MVFEGAQRSQRAIDAAKAERLRGTAGAGLGDGQLGVLVPMRAEAAGNLVASSLLAVATLGRVLFTDDAAGLPSVPLAAAGIVFIAGIALLSALEKRHRPPAVAAPADTACLSERSALVRAAGLRP